MTAAIEAYQALKPRMRGWLHAGAVPAAVIAGLVLILLAPAELRWAAIIYVVSTVALFGISATYHRGTWGPRTHGVLKRMDHATIFIFIAGTYTPIALTVVGGTAGTVLLWIVWLAALAGVIFRVFWVGAPRWLIVPVYISMGWAAVFFIPEILSNGGMAIFLLIAVGGLCYSVGAVIYGLKRPDPSPNWFGFHEIFHSFTLGGYVSHYVGICLAIFGVGVIAH
ncbi:MAG: hemolysin III family protein [Candidatus Nanopelagicales bacterium]|jgi:hemolysin III